MATAKHSLRQRLLRHQGKSYGPFLLSASPTMAELLAGIGYSHMVVDMEHSPLDVSGLTTMLRAIDGVHTNTTSLVRLPSHDNAATTKRVLDVLRPPAGVIFPMIETAAQAQQAVASTRYPPHYYNESTGLRGSRGCAHPFVRASNYGTNPNYFDHDSHQELLTVLQIESLIGIDNIPDIGMLEGVDALFLGPFDISCDMDQMGNFDDGPVLEMLQHAEHLIQTTSQRKLKEQGVPLVLGGFRAPNRSLSDMFARGYQLVSGSLDLGLLQAAARQDWQAGQDAMQEK